MSQKQIKKSDFLVGFKIVDKEIYTIFNRKRFSTLKLRKRDLFFTKSSFRLWFYIYHMIPAFTYEKFYKKIKDEPFIP